MEMSLGGHFYEIPETLHAMNNRLNVEDRFCRYYGEPIDL